MTRSSILHGAIALVFILTCAAGVGAAPERTLNVTLDPPAASQDDMRLKHETTGATKAGSGKLAASQQYQAQTQTKSSGPQKPIGRVGVITASKADIKSAPGSRSSTYYTCPKDAYIAVIGENRDWYGVLMSNGSTGWIAKKCVSLLDYQVVGSQAQANTAGGAIIDTAMKYVGIPYVWGGYSLSGLDCSGFVKAVFASHGISLPRVSRDQANVGAAVPFDQLQAGDRLYFACKGSVVDHTGIYMGNGMFIHASGSRGGVGVDDLVNSRYAAWLVAARR